MKTIKRRKVNLIPILFLCIIYVLCIPIETSASPQKEINLGEATKEEAEDIGYGASVAGGHTEEDASIMGTPSGVDATKASQEELESIGSAAAAAGAAAKADNATNAPNGQTEASVAENTQQPALEGNASVDNNASQEQTEGIESAATAGNESSNDAKTETTPSETKQETGSTADNKAEDTLAAGDADKEEKEESTVEKKAIATKSTASFPTMTVLLVIGVVLAGVIVTCVTIFNKKKQTVLEESDLNSDQS